MDVPSPESHGDTQNDLYPLLLEKMGNPNSHVHIIEVTRNDDNSSISSNDDQPPRVELPRHEDTLSSSTHAPTQATLTVSSRLNSRGSPFRRRGDGYSRRSRSPLNSGLWISVEFLVTMSQIIASIVVLSLSTNENPQAPLFAWVVGYASGCVAALPLHYRRFRNCNRGMEVDTTQSLQGTSERSPESVSYTAISISQASDEESNRTLETVSRFPRVARFSTARLDVLLDHFKFVLDCFFAVWFVVGNVWIFGGHSSPSDAPKLYRYLIIQMNENVTELVLVTLRRAEEAMSLDHYQTDCNLFLSGRIPPERLLLLIVSLTFTGLLSPLSFLGFL